MGARNIDALKANKLPNNKFGLICGSFFVNYEPINYLPMEVSQYKLVVLSDHTFSDDDKIFLNVDGVTMALDVVSTEQNYRNSTFMLCELSATRPQDNIEALLRRANELKRWNAHRLNNEPIRLPSGQVYVRAVRFKPNKELSISAKTFGTKVNFNLKVQNVSKSGLLVADDSGEAPFVQMTIVELVIDPDERVFSERLSCLAKIVRHDPQSDRSKKTPTFAMQFIEIESRLLNVWCEYVEELERNKNLVMVR